MSANVLTLSPPLPCAPFFSGLSLRPLRLHSLYYLGLVIEHNLFLLLFIYLDSPGLMSAPNFTCQIKQ